jgi:hypothetical protein
MPAPPPGVAWLLAIVLFHGTVILIANMAMRSGYELHMRWMSVSLRPSRCTCKPSEQNLESPRRRFRIRKRG